MVAHACEEEGDADGPQLPKFYAGRDVLITGATGFMGKVLIERLLWTCGEVGRLHLLMRSKRDQPPDKRLALLKQSQVFDGLRARSPHQLDKLECVAGDVTLPLLGLSASDIDKLATVSVVFHVAATVKFWEPLGEAVANNVTSVLHLMDLCDRLPHLQALVHVSTAFTNSDRRHIEERVYAPPATLPAVMHLLAALSPQQLHDLTPQYISPKPNTYVFTKCLAEAAVHDRQTRHYSVAIFRPSIVVSSHAAPFPGWVEGLSGASGVVAGMAQGALRVFNIDVHARADMVPVDIAVDTMLAVAWETATDRLEKCRVYYCGAQENSQTWRQFRSSLLRAVRDRPYDHMLYYPQTLGIKNRYVYKALEVLLQTVPLHAAEYLLKICGVSTKLSLARVSGRLRAMTRVLAFFSCREWSFSAHNLRALRRRLLPSDAQLFHLDINQVDWDEHTRHFVSGVRRHVMHNNEDSLQRARKRYHRLRHIHHAVLLLLALCGFKLCKLLLAIIPRATFT